MISLCFVHLARRTFTPLHCLSLPCLRRCGVQTGRENILLICLLQANGQPEPAAAPTFYDIVSGDEDATMRSIVQITNGVTGIVDKVQTLLVYWEKKYKHMWDQDKDAYIRYMDHLPWTNTPSGTCTLCKGVPNPLPYCSAMHCCLCCLHAICTCTPGCHVSSAIK